MSPWEVKANKIISSVCFAAWKEANTKPNGQRYAKHRPYSVPDLAASLVSCLATQDEVGAKAIFLSYDGLRAL